MRTCENCGERVYSLGCVNCDEPAYIEQQDEGSEETIRDCPGCGRRMSAREAVEQGICNDCQGGR
jgi:hypothetical protein